MLRLPDFTGRRAPVWLRARNMAIGDYLLKKSNILFIQGIQSFGRNFSIHVELSTNNKYQQKVCNSLCGLYILDPIVITHFLIVQFVQMAQSTFSNYLKNTAFI